MVAGPGFEPRTEAYETSEMPFLYPAITVVGVQGFEPWTPWSQTRCATRLRYTPNFLRTLIPTSVPKNAPANAGISVQ